MKNVLFTTTALFAVAFAGAASADGHLTWGGSADFGYEAGVDAAGDVDMDSGELTASAGIDFTAKSTLNNGVEAKLTYGFDVDHDGDGSFEIDGDEDAEIHVTGSDFKVIYGAEKYAGAAGGVDNDEGNTLYAETTFGDITGSVSKRLADDENGEEDLELGIAGSFGDLTWGLGFNDQQDGGDEVFGVKLGYKISDFDVSLKAASDESYDLTLGYDAGDFGGEVSFETDGVVDVEVNGKFDDVAFAIGAEDVTEEGGDMNPYIEVDYAMDAVTAVANWSDKEGMEVGLEYDLGGGATAVISYAEDLDLDEDTREENYDPGFDVLLKFAF